MPVEHHPDHIITHTHDLHRRGLMFILSSPSGTGKTTIARRLLAEDAEIFSSVSATTRAPRPGETDGTDYFFITPDAFVHQIEHGGWAEWALVHGNYYGTSALFIDQGLNSGKDILLEIDVQGMLSILKLYPDSITIFIMPPSLEALRDRLELRGTDSREVINTRMTNARKEIAQAHRYRHVIVNECLETARQDLISLIKTYRSNR